MKIAGLLRLTRFPLVFTAIADSAAGYLLSRGGAAKPATLALLAAASACLYACGMVFNDLADLWRDRTLHPERPLPSQQVSVAAARRFALGLMFSAALCGVFLGFAASQIVLALFVLILVYDFFAKRSALGGSLAMGLIRGGNFLLGVLAAQRWEGDLVSVPPWHQGAYLQAGILAAYVVFLTLLSTTEEREGPRNLFAVSGIAMALTPALGLLLVDPSRSASLAPWAAVVGVVTLLGAALLAHLGVCLRRFERSRIMRHVRWSILGIIVLDASLVLGQRPWVEGAAVAALAVPALALFPVFRRL